MAANQSVSGKVKKLRKGRSMTVKMDSNAARVTAWRAFGKGNYATERLSKTKTKIKRLA